MARCTATTASGGPCGARALKGTTLCFFHSPSQTEARSKGRKLGGHRQRIGHGGDATQLTGGVRKVEDVLVLLNYALAETLSSENSLQRGRVLIALANAFVDTFKAAELENRLEAVETTLKIRRRS